MYELCKMKLEVTLLILYLFEIIDRTTNKGDVSPPSPPGGEWKLDVQQSDKVAEVLAPTPGLTRTLSIIVFCSLCNVIRLLC